MNKKSLLILLGFLFLFWYVTSPTNVSSLPTPTLNSKPVVFKKATDNDGDNTVMVTNSSGDIKKASKNLTIDAVNTKITGDLEITGKKLKLGNWTFEEQGSSPHGDGHLWIYRGNKTDEPNKPLMKIAYNGDIWLNATSGGRTANWIAGELANTVKKNTEYGINIGAGYGYTDQGALVGVGRGKPAYVGSSPANKWYFS